MMVSVSRMVSLRLVIFSAWMVHFGLVHSFLKRQYTVRSPCLTQELECRVVDSNWYPFVHTVTVVPNFLDAATCEMYKSVPIPTNSTQNAGEMILVGSVTVLKPHAEKLLAELDRIEGRVGPQRKLEDIPGYTSPRKVLHAKHTLLKQSSCFHVDVYTDGIFQDQLVMGNNAFVFLNSNPSAYFIHDESDPVVANQGDLLIFRGNHWHKTVVEQGELHLLGPMDTEFLLTAGYLTPPSAAPSPMPSSTPPSRCELTWKNFFWKWLVCLFEWLFHKK